MLLDRNRRHCVAGAVIGLALAGCATARTPTEAVVETLASYPHGAFLENLALTRDGSAVVASYADRRLLRGLERDSFATFATLPAHPVGVLETPTGFIVSAHGSPFTAGPAFTQTNQLLLLDKAGRLQRVISAPDARFLNGMVQVGDRVLVADSLAGLIWSFDPDRGELRPWLQHESLAPAASGGRPGVNGLKVRAGRLYLSNSGRGTIQTLGLTASGQPDGPPTPFFSGAPIDDFAFGPDGAIYAATHGQTLLRIDGQGRSSPVLSTGCDSCTAVASLPNGRLLVLTTGDLLEGGEKPARILRVQPQRP